jgi:hypothetical protein
LVLVKSPFTVRYKLTAVMAQQQQNTDIKQCPPPPLHGEIKRWRPRQRSSL